MKMIKRSLLFLTFLFLIISGNSQEVIKANDFQVAKNSVIASVGGAGVYYSILYERQVFSKEKYSIGVKGGIGSSFSPVLFPNEFNFPVGAFFLYGKKNSHLDLSISLTSYILQQYDFENSKNSNEYRLLSVPSIAYRYQKKNGGLIGKIGFCAIINFNSVTNSFVPWLDVGVGWAF